MDNNLNHRSPLFYMNVSNVTIYMALLVFTLAGIYLYKGLSMPAGFIPFHVAVLNTALIGICAFVAEMADSLEGKKNGFHYATLMYLLLSLIFPTALVDTYFLAANLLVVLFFYNLFDFSDKMRIKMRILSASLYLSVASFMLPEVLFLAPLLYVGILMYCPSDVRNFMVPLIGYAGAYILVFTYHYVFEHTIFIPENPLELLEIYTAQANSPKTLSAIIFSLVWVVAGVFIYLRRASHNKKSKRIVAINLFVAGFALALGCIFYSQSPSFTIFMIFPFAVILSKTLEYTRSKILFYFIILYYCAMAVIQTFFS